MPQTPPFTTLPIVDLREGDDAATRDSFRRNLLAVSREVGFFYLVGHEIAEDRQAEMFAVARRLFALSDEAKQRVEMVHSPAFRGFTRLGGERTRGSVDWREQIDIGIGRPAVTVPEDQPWYVLQGPNQWPAECAVDLSTVEEWIRDLGALSDRLLRHWAAALGQDEHVWDPIFAADPHPLLKLVHYPASDDPARVQGVGGHKDSGILTLLLLEAGSTGLQVEHDGAWIDAAPPPGAFVVNIGEMLEVATQGLLKATEHRVTGTANDRLSIPYFHAPRLSGTFTPLSLPPELAEAATGVSQQGRNLLHATYGANTLKSRLRSHPDVAQRHHPDLLARGLDR